MPFPRGLTLPHEQRRTLVSSRRSQLLKEHECSVIYPDGMPGTCRYERFGPACHQFTFRYCDGALLSKQYQLKPLDNTTLAIASVAQERTEPGFQDAIEHERRHYFARATAPGGYRRALDRKRSYVKPAEAKAHGGKYALCLVLGTKLLCVSAVVPTLDVANQMWTERGDTRLVVACCNRWERRWEQPRYNTLYKRIGFPDLERQAERQRQLQMPAPEPTRAEVPVSVEPVEKGAEYATLFAG